MVALYVKMIREGKLEMEQVHPKWRDEVAEELKKEIMVER